MISNFLKCLIAAGLLAAPVFAQDMEGHEGHNHEGHDHAGHDHAAPPAVGAPPAPPQAPAMPSPDDVVVIVDGAEITHGEVMQRTQAMMQQMQGRMPQQQMQMMMGQFYMDAQNRAISDRLLAKAADAKDISVEESKVDEEITKASEGLPPGMTLEDALSRMGTDLEAWKVQLTEQMEIQELVESVVADVPEASEEDITAFYNENPDQFKTQESVDASHILIGFDASDTEEQKAEKKEKLEDLRKQIEEGADFAALAQEHSSCPSSQKGGNLGNFGRGRMVPAFDKAVFEMEPGDLSGIVETNFGFHIIKLNEKTETGTMTLEEVHDRLATFLSNQKKQEALGEYIEGLRETAEITFPMKEETP